MRLTVLSFIAAGSSALEAEKVPKRFTLQFTVVSHFEANNSIIYHTISGYRSGGNQKTIAASTRNSIR